MTIKTTSFLSVNECRRQIRITSIKEFETLDSQEWDELSAMLLLCERDLKKTKTKRNSIFQKQTIKTERTNLKQGMQPIDHQLCWRSLAKNGKYLRF